MNFNGPNLNGPTPNNTTTDPTPDDLARLLDLPGPDPATTARLHARLAAAADRAGILDVAYRTVDTSVGTLLLAATDAGLVRVAYGGDRPDGILSQLASLISPRVLLAPGRLDDAAREIEEYLAGHRREFDLPLDLRLASGFRRAVLDRLPDIAYGTTASYAGVAAAAGSPRAFRAVGSACATNPLPIVVPCHRVIHSDGSIGSYAGGGAVKSTLLGLEARG